MSPFLASIETFDHGTFTYGFHLGTDERVARQLCEDLIRLAHFKGRSCRVRTVGLMRDGALFDTFDGAWLSVMLDRMYAEELDREFRADVRYHGA